MAASASPDIGLLRHRLIWQTTDQSQLDSMNQPIDSWANVGTYWAHVQPLSGMELMNARQLKGTTSHKILLRNPGAVNNGNGIKPSDRFSFEATGRLFGIDSVFRVDERNAYLLLHCSELINRQ
jgi:SPP1 family predicted phage head-tail adaptor